MVKTTYGSEVPDGYQLLMWCSKGIAKGFPTYDPDGGIIPEDRIFIDGKYLWYLPKHLIKQGKE